MDTNPHIEKIDSAIIPDELLRVRDKTWQAVQKIAAAIKPGMLQEDAFARAQALLKDMGSFKAWHRPYVHFGVNTTRSYADDGVVPGVRLNENDIFYIDIGPVWDGIEGDAGASFVTGNDPEMLKATQDTRVIFDCVKREWSERGLSGAKLYDFAAEEARKLGWILNVKASGHRIADFPHALYYKGDLIDVGFKPSPYVWVLEIHIRHPKRKFGAFYEDVLF